MFGYSAIPVINQKNAPAIWESDFVDFPANFIAGRILIATDNGAIYLDLTSSRIALQAGAMGTFTATNGLEINNSTPFATEIGLGGQMFGDKTINTSTNTLSFIGNLLQENQFDTDGVFKNTNTGKDYMPLSEIPFRVIFENCLLEIQDTRTNQIYKVAAHKV
jgi:hypothetical protein